MNSIKSALTFFPALIAYLKGVNEFHCRNFSCAISYFNKCIDHPKFKNELFYAHYGQTLCALGQLEESFIHLIAAYDIFNKSNWNFERQHEHNLAEGTLSALRYISENSEIDVPKEVLETKIKGCPTK